MIRFTLFYCFLCASTGLLAQQTEASTSAIEGDGVFQADSVILEKLGADLCQRINDVKKIWFHAVDPVIADSLGTPNIQGFPIRKTKRLKKKLQKDFFAVLSKKESFYLGSRVKMCYFLPDMALELRDNTDTISILISLECDLVRYYFKKNGKQEFITLNSDYSNDKLTHLYKLCLKSEKTVAPEEEEEKEEPDLAVREEENLGLNIRNPLYLVVKAGEGWSHIAKRASQEYEMKILIEDICKINNIDYQEAIANKIQPQKGEEIIVGFKQ